MRSDGFNLKTATQCALYSHMAYLAQPTIEDKRTNTQVLIRDAGEAVVVAFRGSQEISDFIIDGRFKREKALYGEIHSGFGAACCSVLDNLGTHLLGLEARRILFTGHSLGGALAILAAHMTAIGGFDDVHVYTFGQPRVSDSAFAKNYDRILRDRTFRIVNGNDIVPRIPGACLGYRHCGTEIVLPQGPTWRLELNPKLWAMAGTDAIGVAKRWAINRALAMLMNHDMEQYIGGLQRL